ncbi:MAG TPA: aldo/keto reductase [Magnetospirillaceae bacterium]|jgi:aryl-alcohol dehydrogenase-like predicted oxidoreductase
MENRQLGASGIAVSALGLGCLSFSGYYGSGGRVPADDARKLIDRALGLGVNFFDTAAMYVGSEELLGSALKGRREKRTIATKFGVILDTGGRPAGMDARPEAVVKACDESLLRLGIDVIDLFYLHRIDRAVPIEDTVGALADLIHAGKIKGIGLCEVSSVTLRRAHGTHPIAAVQSEYSLWSREVEDKILPTCRELGIAFVPYSPLGRGFLSGEVKAVDDLPTTDIRRAIPRFQAENFARNQALMRDLAAMAARYEATPAQVALAWLLRQGDDIVPIPGTKHIKYLEENACAVNVRISPDDVATLSRTFAPDRIAGERHGEASGRFVDTEPGVS